MKSTPIKFLFISLCLLFATVSCEKSKCTETKIPEVNVPVPDAERANLYYRRNENLVFFRQPQNDTVTYYCQDFTNYYPITDFGEDNCSSHKYLFERRGYTFHGPNTFDGMRDFSIEQNIPLVVPSVGYSEIIIKSDYDIFREHSELITHAETFDSIVFGDKTYKNLVVFGSNNKQQNVPLNKRCYINKEDGLVRMVLSYGDTYTLIRRYYPF